MGTSLVVPPPLGDFDFSLLDSHEFKEDSVREEIILPILNSLGYSPSGPNKIIRSKGLEHPFLTVGSKKKPITLIPDYLLTVEGNFTFVLDAKGPSEDIKSGHNVEQVYSYAIHPEIRVDVFALCNGREFILFEIHQKEPILYFQVSELEHHWDDIQKYLAPAKASSQLPKRLRNIPLLAKQEFDYLSFIPPNEITNFQKQTAKRHFGVHGYFTKQVWSVVQHYIKTFTRPGDTVLDPFGGSGVTLVEALMLGRKAIHIDLNPLSEFIVRNLIEPINLDALADSFHNVVDQFNEKAPVADAEISKALKRYPYPKNVRLPKNSDVRSIEQLFSEKQLAQLAYLKFLIQKENPAVRDCLMLMFSGLLNKVNLTYHSSEGRTEGRGDSSVFRYYRYRIDDKTNTYRLRKNRKFKTHIPLELRVRYFVVSFLRRLEHRHDYPTFDDIILNIMPLLKNGVTPEHQTILNVLESVAERVGADRWRLIKSEQRLLF